MVDLPDKTDWNGAEDAEITPKAQNILTPKNQEEIGICPECANKGQ